MSSKQLILVTGINGFLGSHIVDQLVKDGYRVRGTVRSHKVASARESNVAYGGDVDVVAIDDLAYGDFSEALQGVHAVIHPAAPIFGKEAIETALTATVEGAVNILRQTEKAGIKRFILMSSLITVRMPDDPFPMWNETEWLEVTREKALASHDPVVEYATAKVLAEKAVWAFADTHPNIDVTTLNPPFFIGPFAHKYRFTDALLSELSTNLLLYQLFQPGGRPFSRSLLSIDVRDSARALVNALTSPTDVGRKRLLILSHAVGWKEVAEFVAEARPELKDRLSKPVLNGEYPPTPPNPVNNTRTVELLELGELIDWKTSVLAAVDAVVEQEKRFAQEGKAFY
ncbi:NAD-P-binding protein [Trametes elegans]|nr:NAD-P-binding protein [Trametes elegans]